MNSSEQWQRDLISILVGVLIALAIISICGCQAAPTLHGGTVVGKKHIDAYSYTTFETYFDFDGDLHTRLVEKHEPERWVVTVEGEADGVKLTRDVDVDSKLYAKLVEGEFLWIESPEGKR